MDSRQPVRRPLDVRESVSVYGTHLGRGKHIEASEQSMCHPNGRQSRAIFPPPARFLLPTAWPEAIPWAFTHCAIIAQADSAVTKHPGKGRTLAEPQFEF